MGPVIRSTRSSQMSSRSPSKNSTMSPRAAMTPSSVEAPFPSSVLIITLAPALTAISPVPSMEPSSMTTTSSTAGLRRARRTKWSMVSASLSTGMSTDTVGVDTADRRPAPPGPTCLASWSSLILPPPSGRASPRLGSGDDRRSSPWPPGASARYQRPPDDFLNGVHL